MQDNMRLTNIFFVNSSLVPLKTIPVIHFCCTSILLIKMLVLNQAGKEEHRPAYTCKYRATAPHQFNRLKGRHLSGSLRAT